MNDWKDILAGLQSSGKLSEDNERDNETVMPSGDDTEQTNDNAKYPVLKIFYEKKGRSGKPATIIEGFDPDDEASLALADALARTLKQRLGCGGSARGGEILLQGDRRDKLRELLPTLGYKKIKG